MVKEFIGEDGEEYIQISQKDFDRAVALIRGDVESLKQPYLAPETP